MLSRVQSGFDMAREEKRRPAGGLAADFYGHAADWDDELAGGSALGGDCWSMSAPLEPARPQYLWENIPPRLTTAAPDADLLQLPDDDGFGYEDEVPEPAAAARWWMPQERSAPQRSVSTVSVSISGAEGAPAEEAGAAGRRPLHTSGGRVAAPQQLAGPQIAIGLPAAEPSGHIQLQISGGATSLTVSVQTRPAAAARPRRPPHAATAAAAAAAAAARDEPAEPEEDKALARALGLLRDSGWYYGSLSWQQAQLALQSTAEGTFLARDSHHRKFVFALSMQTARGPTSMRVQLWRGRFRLDAPSQLLEGMPTFADVNALVEHYARRGLMAVDGGQLKVRLGRPLRKSVPSLQHCCRLALHGSGVSSQRLDMLPPQLRSFLDQYPYGR